MLNLAVIYRLNKLKAECIQYISKKFDQNQIDKNIEFNKIETDIKLSIYKEKSTFLEEQTKSKEVKIKQMQDEVLKQKFEINRLNKLLENKTL
jgi:hypothetical protein